MRSAGTASGPSGCPRAPMRRSESAGQVPPAPPREARRGGRQASRVEASPLYVRGPECLQTGQRHRRERVVNSCPVARHVLAPGQRSGCSLILQGESASALSILQVGRIRTPRPAKQGESDSETWNSSPARSRDDPVREVHSNGAWTIVTRARLRLHRHPRVVTTQPRR
jgi:hypothetical protein